MVKVAVVRSWYLPLSETFIYSELKGLKRTDAIVCTRRLMNERHFPFQPIYQYQTMKDLGRILREQGVDLIHARFGLTGAELLDVKQALRIPMLTSFHGFDLPTNRKSRKKYGDQLERLFREGDLFTATSEDMKEILISHGCPKDKVMVHHSGIDLRQFQEVKRKTPKRGDAVVLSVGRLVEKKGMADLVAAMARVVKKHPSVKLRIVGDGALHDALVRQVKKLGLKRQVYFAGALSHGQVIEEMRRAHLFVLASHTDRHGNREGIPNVLKEAMATGLPVVSTKHAGIPELVQHGKSGLLVPERDPKALAKAISSLLKSPDEWGRMGKRGRRMVCRAFDAQTQVQELEGIYHTLCKGAN